MGGLLEIYFSCSISGGRQYAHIYKAIVDHLQVKHHVLNAHIADPSLSEHGENIPVSIICARDIGWVRRANVIVAESSVPSIGVGDEMAEARRVWNPVVSLYKISSERGLSGMVSGRPYNEIIRYSSLEELLPMLDVALSNLPSKAELRRRERIFNATVRAIQ